jgi:hypothetical protein
MKTAHRAASSRRYQGRSAFFAFLPDSAKHKGDVLSYETKEQDMFEDKFRNSVDTPTAPSERCFAIVPDDANDVDHGTKAIFIGVGGDVSLVSVRGEQPVLFRNIPSGSILDVRVRAVKASGTTATDIVGLA